MIVIPGPIGGNRKSGVGPLGQTLQQAYNASAGANPSILLTALLGALGIKAPAVAMGTIFQVLSNGGTALIQVTDNGALTINAAVAGNGLFLQSGGVTLLDIEGTSSNTVTLAANKSLQALAGTGQFNLGPMTGLFNFPTGTVTWTGATGKSVSLTCLGAGSFIQLNGAQRFQPLTNVADANYTVDSGATPDYGIVYTSISANRTVTLPNPVAAQAGRRLFVKKATASATNNVLFTTVGGVATVETGTTYTPTTISGFAAWVWWCDGATSWWLESEKGSLT